MTIRKLPLLTLALLLGGCVSSGYEKFYFENAQASSEPAAEKRSTDQPIEIRESKYPVSDYEKLQKKGYYSVGESLFIGPLESDEGIHRKAKDNGATLVLKTVTFQWEVTSYRKVYDPHSGMTYEPIIARPDGDADFGEVEEKAAGEPSYAKKREYLQRAIYLVRKGSLES
jgi:hypothetical protein